MIGFNTLSCTRPLSTPSLEEFLERVLRPLNIKVVSGFDASQGQILVEDHYADLYSQSINNEHILSLCHTAALKPWDKITVPKTKQQQQKN